MSSFRRPNIDTLAERGDVDRLVADLRDPSESVRYSAAEALGHIGDALAIGPLTGGVRIDKRDVTAALLDVLDREPETPADVGKLLKALNYDERLVGVKAIKALARTRDPRAIRRLTASGAFVRRTPLPTSSSASSRRRCRAPR